MVGTRGDWQEGHGREDKLDMRLSESGAKGGKLDRFLGPSGSEVAADRLLGNSEPPRNLAYSQP